MLFSSIIICFLHLSGAFLLTLCTKRVSMASSDQDFEPKTSKKEPGESSKMDQQQPQPTEKLEISEKLESENDRKKAEKREKKARKKAMKAAKKAAKARKKRKNKGGLPEDFQELKPKKVPYNEKEQKIATGLKVASTDYPTLDNVKSDWGEDSVV